MAWIPVATPSTEWPDYPRIAITTEDGVSLTTEDGVVLATDTDTRADIWTAVPLAET